MTEIAQAQCLIDGPTRLYGIIGDPIGQVKSPLAFNPRLKAAGMDAVLVPFHVPQDRFEATVRGLMALGNLDGLVVTVPYKALALSLVDEVLPTGQRVGAINAMRREADGRWVGDMFDGRGLVRGLKERGVSVEGRRVMLLGAGGAGSAVAVACAEAGAASIAIHDVDAARADRLAARVAEAFPTCHVARGAPRLDGINLLVNATPTGMAPGDGLPVVLPAFDPRLLVVDIIMKPEVTPLLARAQAAGCRTFGGRTMLEGQIEELTAFFGIGGAHGH